MTSAETEISADGKVTSQRYIIDFLALFWVFLGIFLNIEMILAHALHFGHTGRPVSVEIVGYLSHLSPFGE